MRVLITGATGFIGSAVCEHLAQGGHRVSVLSRDPGVARERLASIAEAVAWQPDAEPAPVTAIEGIDAIVHLAGESVAARWSSARKAAIRNSRILGTRNLVAGLAAATSRPRVLVSSSAIGYYGDRGNDLLTEDSAPGSGFLADVCRGWEKEARAAESLGLKVIRLRTGIVLGADGGALAQMLTPAKLGLGGPLGSGRQWWSWIHLHDVVRLVAHCLEATGNAVYNNTSPVPVRQKEFARCLGRALGRPAFLPAPGVALRIVLGGFSSELLGSKRVIPEATLGSGFRYRFPELEAALEDLIS